MTPAEREALKLAAEDAMENGVTSSKYTGRAIAWFRMASPKAILSLLSDLASMEVTLGNAVSAGALQEQRINKLEAVIRDYREDHSCDSGREHFHSCFGDCPICKTADELLAPSLHGTRSPVPSQKENVVYATDEAAVKALRSRARLISPNKWNFRIWDEEGREWLGVYFKSAEKAWKGARQLLYPKTDVKENL